MRVAVVALLALLAVVAVSAEEKNPIRAIRARYKEKVAKWEKFFDEDPLGQKIAEHYAKLKELIKEVRLRIRKALAKYVKELENAS